MLLVERDVDGEDRTVVDMLICWRAVPPAESPDVLMPRYCRAVLGAGNISQSTTRSCQSIVASIRTRQEELYWTGRVVYTGDGNI